VNYKDEKKMTDEEKRKVAKEELSKIKNKQTSTGIADSPYVQNVIKAYVEGNHKVEKKLYKEPPLNLAHADMEQIL